MRSKYLGWVYLLAAPAFALLLNACGGGGTSGSGTGTLSASITDSAIEELSEVNLRVLAIELRRRGDNGNGVVEVDLTNPNDGSAMEFNLLDYQHGAIFPLFQDERVPSGDYVQARLVLEAPAQTAGACAVQDPLSGSHVVMNAGGMTPIYVPSGSNNGVRLVSPFTVPEDSDAHIVLDLDLRKALHQPTGQICYFLRPTFRVETMRNTGEIAGTVAMSLLDGTNGLCSDDDPATGNAVYVYSGSDQTADDIDAVNDGNADPVATSKVSLDSVSGDYKYVVAYLPAGAYTVAFTCEVDLDRIPDPDGATPDEQQADDDINFQLPQNATVVMGQTEAVSFAP